MATKTVRKTIEIDATREQLWRVLFDEDSYEVWATAFSAEAHVETDWQRGHRVKFTDGNGDGLIGRIAEHIPEEILVIEYDGQLKAGLEDFGSKDALAMKGLTETYTVSDGSTGGTKLHVVVEIPEEYYDMMDKMWDDGMQKIKELAEK